MPNFAPAYSSLAQLNNSDHIVRPGVFRNLARSEQSLMYAREAARLDPIDSRSQLCLGWSHAMVKQYEQAILFIPLAYELNENDPWTMVSSAGCFAVCGEYPRARRSPSMPWRCRWHPVRYSGPITSPSASWQATTMAPCGRRTRPAI